MLAVVKAVADMIANFCGWRSNAVEHQATSEVIDDKKDLEKACNYAESAFEIIEAHASVPEKYSKKVEHYIRKFRRFK